MFLGRFDRRQEMVVDQLSVLPTSIPSEKGKPASKAPNIARAVVRSSGGPLVTGILGDRRVVG